MSHTATIIGLLKDYFGDDITGISPTPLHDSADVSGVFVTVQEVINTQVTDLSGQDNLSSSVMQVNCWSDDYEAASNLRVRARDYLASYVGGGIQGVTHRNDAELY